MKHISKVKSLLVIALVITGMIGCKKSMDVNPYNQPQKQLFGNPKEATTVIMSNNGPVNEGDQAIFTATITAASGAVTCGKITLQKWDTATLTWVAIEDAQNMLVTDGSASYTIDTAALTDNGSYRWHYVGGDCDYNESKSNGMDLVVNASCSGLTLVATETTGNCGTGNYSITYTIHACGGSYTNLKLQGGLTAGSTNVTASGGTISTKKGSNSVITWNIGTLTQGSSTSRTVSFTKTVISENTNITGNWSVKGKDANNVDVVAGYNNAVTASPCAL